ncbi:MAG: chemotaxis protein CheW [Limisphaerales bacterium]
MSTVHIRKRDLEDCWNQVGIWGDSSCEELEQQFHCRNCPVYANAARHLLNNRTTADYREEWTEHLSQETETPPEDLAPVLVFRLGDHWMALAADVVEEVAEMSQIHSVPHRREEVLRGVVNIRGELLICVSLGRWFGFHKSIHADVRSLEGREERLVVTGPRETGFVFPVSHVRGIRHYESGKLQKSERPDYPVANDFCVGMAEITNVESAEPTRVHILDHEPLFRAISMSLS